MRDFVNPVCRRSRSVLDRIDGGLHPRLDGIVGESTVDSVGCGTAEKTGGCGGVLGVGDRPEAVAMVGHS
ncbi:hypothetical protein [Halorhabdus amylolytica]|uniref:hypothetical protein n=1 Tax=Halorhabdus amylolytica TaxID=2559573 RepID=UPI0010A9E40C|nr:hypothetical protein [Halorhabdus amylolytica]